MIPDYILREIALGALKEDLGHGDLTTWGVGLDTGIVEARILLREDAVVSGHRIAKVVFQLLDTEVKYTPLIEDGDSGGKDSVIALIKGPGHAVLGGERTALNFLMYLSGIATLTRRYVKALEGTGVRLLDTRKTIPGLRDLIKEAVRHGGGHNHRLGLDGGVLIKDTHLGGLESIGEAVRQTKERIPHSIRVQVEVTSVEQAEEAVEAGADALLLDNMSVQEVCEVCERFRQRVFIEVSGGITLDNIKEFSSCKPHAISSSSMVKEARWIDMSMKVGKG